MSKPSFSRKRKGKRVDPYPLGSAGPSKSSRTKGSRGRPRKPVASEEEGSLVQGKYYLVTYEQQEPVLVWVREIEDGEVELDVLSHADLAYGSVGPGDMMYVHTDDPELESVKEITDVDAEFARLTANQARAYLSMELEGRIEEAEDDDEMEIADSLARLLERVERKEMEAEDYTEATAQLHLMLEDETYPDGEEEGVERALEYFKRPVQFKLWFGPDWPEEEVKGTLSGDARISVDQYDHDEKGWWVSVTLKAVKEKESFMDEYDLNDGDRIWESSGRMSKPGEKTNSKHTRSSLGKEKVDEVRRIAKSMDLYAAPGEPIEPEDLAFATKSELISWILGYQKGVKYV